MLAPADLDRLFVVLVGTRNPLNIGAAARAMSNFGFGHLRLVSPYEPAFREARSAVGAASVLQRAQEYPDLSSAISDCQLVIGTSAVRHRELQHPLVQLPMAGSFLRQRIATQSVALLFGSEKVGLSNDDLSYCHQLLHIPTREQHLSMNLGQAVAVCLYEIVREETPHAIAADPQPDHAPAGLTDRLSTALSQLLLATQYTSEAGQGSAENKVRRLIHRLQLQSADAELLLGMFRQMSWKLKNPGVKVHVIDEPSD